MASRRRGERLRAAARKEAARALEAIASTGDQVEQVVAGVRVTAALIVDVVPPGSLWWSAPLQFIAEQASVRVCKHYEIPMDRVDDVAAYLLGGLQEYMHAMIGEFDMQHFETWVAALTAREEGGAGREPA